MSRELINRISIKKNRVYVSTHSSNDTSPYCSVEVPFLTKAYQEGGQHALDKEIVNMCFSYCELRGNHKSILPYKDAIDVAINRKDFNEIRNKYRELDDKAFDIANRFDEYKNISDEKKDKLYNEVNLERDNIRNQRNEYVAKIVEKERIKLNGPKEITEGIYEVIPIHRKSEGLGEVYSEYMNFNTNNGTIIYEKRLGFLQPCPDVMKISKYQELINKNGLENISGAKEFKKFIEKYPEIYVKGVENEEIDKLENKEEEEDVL